ncbi:unnamed protein product [Cladocopium goreaui]|uniref:Sodium channel protein type 4 subunit alpha A n=2 Tax=Cladocopium goreaui TaxID=2562237 RepID=A0A9P1GSM2_9DINO|nr:unnamed protein product [Cladocopium goreaui]
MVLEIATAGEEVSRSLLDGWRQLVEEQHETLRRVMEEHRAQWDASLRSGLHRNTEGDPDRGGRGVRFSKLTSSTSSTQPQQPEVDCDPVPVAVAPWEDFLPLDLKSHHIEVAMPTPPKDFLTVTEVSPNSNTLSDGTFVVSSSADGTVSRSARHSTVSKSVKPVDFQLTERSLNGWSLVKIKFRKTLDFVATALVILNCILLMVELELEGRAVGSKLGLSDGVDLTALMPWFQGIDHTFILIFLLELVLRLVLDGRNFCKDIANLFDTILVITGCVDILVLAPIMGNENAAMMRVVRTLKSLRALRLLRTFRFVRGLRLLVKACQCFLPSLCWAMVLLAVFMSIGALVLGNLLLDFSASEVENYEDRQWVWLHYGTSYRALYTLYEVTFAGNWPTNVRPILNKVSHFYVLFFVFYVTVITFAVIRVISAVFLKDTLDAAQNDAENLVVERLRKKDEYVARLEAVFSAIDKEGDGMITEERLTNILSHPKVEAYFQTLDIDVQESANLFHIIDNGDGEVTLDEFIDGIMRCKGQARAVDQVAMRFEVAKLDTKITELIVALRVAGVIPYSTPKGARGESFTKE